MEGFPAEAAAGFTQIKLNAGIRGGLNDTEIPALVDFARANGHTLRLIEYMDVGTTNGWRLDEVLNPSVYEESLAEDIRRVTIADGQGLCAGGRPLLGPDQRAPLRQALTEVPAHPGAAGPPRVRALDLTCLLATTVPDAETHHWRLGG